MADQTQVNRKNDEAPFQFSNSLKSDTGGIAHDLLLLAELQSQLFVAEVREVGKRSILPSLFLTIGLTLGASCVPFALTAFAFGLAHLASLSLATAFMIVLAVGLFSSLMLLIVSWLLVRKHKQFFRRSQEEFFRNYQWFKSTFKNNRVAPRNSINLSKELKR